MDIGSSLRGYYFRIFFLVVQIIGEEFPLSGTQKLFASPAI
jgi:hypothetical protein